MDVRGQVGSYLADWSDNWSMTLTHLAFIHSLTSWYKLTSCLSLRDQHPTQYYKIQLAPPACWIYPLLKQVRECQVRT